MATMRLFNFIKISNFADADFAEVMIETKINNTNSENDSKYAVENFKFLIVSFSMWCNKKNFKFYIFINNN